MVLSSVIGNLVFDEQVFLLLRFNTFQEQFGISC